MRFLLVDDSATVRYMLASGLKQIEPRAQIDQASNPVEAVAAYRANRPDVVFLDMMMDGAARGTDVLGEILKEKVDQRVVLLTGLSGDDPNVVSAISDGAFAYLQKPVRVDAIRDVLDDMRSQDGNLIRVR